MKKEWTGNTVSTFKNMGAKGQNCRAPGDFYSTSPLAIQALENAGKLPVSNKVWECAAGRGDLADALLMRGYDVVSTDLHDRGYCSGGVDFLKCGELLAPCILTNPPYSLVTEFCVHALELGAEEVYMFMKLQFLEGKRRYREIYSKHPPSEILQFVERMTVARNGDRSLYGKPSAMTFCWMVWRKGHEGKPEVSWISAEPNLLHPAA